MTPTPKDSVRDRRQRRASTILLWIAGTLVILLALGYVLAPSSPKATTTETFVGTAPGDPNGFGITFTVAGSAIRKTVVAWDATCQSGKVWSDHTLAAYAPATGWTGARDYVTRNEDGITERVHVISDTGRLTSRDTASGVFSLSLSLYRNVTKIDSCRTPTDRWTATARGR